MAKHSLISMLEAALRHRCQIKPTQRLLLAVSGGGDSVALLRLMHTLAQMPRWHFQLAVGHVQHHLRPNIEANADADFVQQLAMQLDINFARRDLDLKNLQGNVESHARTARYNALLDMANQFKADAVLVAHHADDQLETVLLRLIRGASVHGLSSMRWRRQFTEAHPTLQLVRPMLGFDREQILDYLHTIKQPWQEDHTNLDQTKSRAKLRHQVLPILKSLRHDAAKKAVHAADHLHDVSQYMNRVTAQQLKKVTLANDPLNTKKDTAINDEPSDKPTTTWQRTKVRDVDTLILLSMVRQTLIKQGVPRDRLSRNTLMPAIFAMKDTVGGSRKIQLSQSHQITITRNEVSIC